MFINSLRAGAHQENLMDDECEYVQGYITTRKEMMGNTDICETRDPYSYVSSLVPFDFGKIDTRL